MTLFSCEDKGLPAAGLKTLRISAGIRNLSVICARKVLGGKESHSQGRDRYGERPTQQGKGSYCFWRSIRHSSRTTTATTFPEAHLASIAFCSSRSHTATKSSSARHQSIANSRHLVGTHSGKVRPSQDAIETLGRLATLVGYNLVYVTLESNRADLSVNLIQTLSA